MYKNIKKTMEKQRNKTNKQTNKLNKEKLIDFNICI